MARSIKVFVFFAPCLTAILFISWSDLFSQDTIYLKNPSFEDIPRKGGQYSPSIKEWRDCGRFQFPGESPPDIHPTPEKSWNVDMQPYDGKTFLGLVVRYNDTYESVSQELERPLLEGRCYSMSAYLARSNAYLSGTSRSINKPENFTQPAILMFWGGDEYCWQGELLGQSTPVDNSDWKLNEFEFKPIKTHYFLTIVAYYSNEAVKRYNGHVMVDRLSPIMEINCKN